MAQLIATTDIKSIKLICQEKGNIQKVYSDKYLFIKEFLAPEAYKVFAEPIFKSNQKINWNTEFEGTIYPISRADEVLENYLEVLENYVRNIYTYVLLKAKNLDDKKKALNLLDNLFTVKTIDDVYLIISGDNKSSFCFINWCQNDKPEVNPIAGLFNPKSVDVEFTIQLGDRPATEHPIWIKIDGQEKQFVSDSKGKIILNNIELLSDIEVIQKDEQGRLVKSQKFTVDKQSFMFFLEHTNSLKLQLKVVDKNDKPLANTGINVVIEGEEKSFNTDSNGLISLGEVKLGTKIIVEQKITDSRKITRTYSIDKQTQNPIVFKGERLSGKFFIIKVIDVNNKPFENATLEIINGDNRFIRHTSKEGIAVINDVQANEKIIIRHIVGNSAVAQRTVEYGQDREIIFKTHIEQKVKKNIKVKILYGEKPISNLSVKLRTKDDWQHTVTNEKGEGLFKDVDCSSHIILEFRHHNRDYNYNITCEDVIEINLRHRIQPKIKKAWWVALGIILLGFLIFLAVNNIKLPDRKNNANLVDTIKKVEKKKTFNPYKAKVFLLYEHNKFPVSNARVFLSLDSSQRALKYDSGYFYVNVEKPDTLIFKVQLEDNKEFEFKKLPNLVDTILVRLPDVVIANDTTCNTYIYKQGVRIYIQTFRYPMKMSKIRFRFRKFYHSDQIRIYYGEAKDIRPERLVKDFVIYSDTVRYMVNLPQPDSLITFEIIAGEPNFPVWGINVLCK